LSVASQAKQLEKEEQELQNDLDELLADTMKREWAKNAAIWLGVVLGSFAIILLLLVAISGG
jgi:hypothetical protein